MAETIWIYDDKKAEKRAKEQYELFRSIHTDKDMEKMENDDQEYLYSLSEEERKNLLEMEKFIEENKERYEKEKKERLKKYDGGTIIASRPIEVDNGFSDTKDIHVFTAVEKNSKIGIFFDDWQEEWLFCDYLRDEKELELFFESIDIRKELIYYQYRRGSKNGYDEHIDVNFVIYDRTIGKEIYFNYSRWYPPYEDIEKGLVEDNSYNDRDELVRLYLDLSESKI